MVKAESEASLLRAQVQEYFYGSAMGHEPLMIEEWEDDGPDEGDLSDAGTILH